MKMNPKDKDRKIYPKLKAYVEQELPKIDDGEILAAFFDITGVGLKTALGKNILPILDVIPMSSNPPIRMADADMILISTEWVRFLIDGLKKNTSVVKNGGMRDGNGKWVPAFEPSVLRGLVLWGCHRSEDADVRDSDPYQKGDDFCERVYRDRDMW